MRKEDARGATLTQRPDVSEYLEFGILTAVRHGMVREARWDEIDTENRVWYPSHHKTKKKTKTDYVVPLSKQAWAVLERMRERRIAEGNFSETGLIFMGRRRIGLIHETQAIEFVQKNLGLDRPDDTVHGFRTTFGGWVEEETNFPEKDSEMALGHTFGSVTRNIYKRHAKRIEPRRRMMQAWADYCDGISNIFIAKKGEVA
jgi:integrase